MKPLTVLDLIAAASQTISKQFHNALSANYVLRSPEMMLANHNSGRLLTSLKGAAL